MPFKKRKEKKKNINFFSNNTYDVLSFVSLEIIPLIYFRTNLVWNNNSIGFSQKKEKTIDENKSTKEHLDLITQTSGSARRQWSLCIWLIPLLITSRQWREVTKFAVPFNVLIPVPRNWLKIWRQQILLAILQYHVSLTTWSSHSHPRQNIRTAVELTLVQFPKSLWNFVGNHPV